MKGDKKVIRGTIWNLLGSTMYGVNSFVMLVLVSRVGTVEQAGHFAIAFTTAQILYIIGLLGTNHYQMTDYKEKYSFSVYAHVKIFSSVLMVVVGVGSAVLLRFQGDKLWYLGLLTILMILNSAGELYQALFFQKNRLDLSGSALFFRTLWSLIAFAAALFFLQNILLALAVQIFVNLFVTLYYAWYKASAFRGQTANKTELPPHTLVQECMPLFGSSLLMNLIINASKYGIELLSTDTIQGYFNMIFMPVQLINLVSQFAFKPLLNRYSDLLSARKFAEFRMLFFRQIFLILCFTFICAMAAYAFGAEVLGFVYDKDISAYRGSLVLAVIGGGIFAMCQLFYYILVILRLQKRILLIYVLATALTITITAIFVSNWEIVGATAAFAVTQIFILCAYGWTFQRYCKKELRAGNGNVRD